MKKFQYLIKINAGEKELNDLGKEGWELIFLTETNYGDREFIFKRTWDIK
jgi:hypothetical protein